MSGHIRGIDVILYQQVETEPDEFGKMQYTEVPVTVSNVLVAPTSSDDYPATNDLTSRGETYTMAIPKGDTHDWEDKHVRFFNKDWHTFGIPLQGIECDIPLDWNMKVMVERYE